MTMNHSSSIRKNSNIEESQHLNNEAEALHLPVDNNYDVINSSHAGQNDEISNDEDDIEDDDDWLIASITKYKVLHMYNLHHPVCSMVGLGNNRLCICCSTGHVQKELQELKIPGKLLSNPDNEVPSGERDFKIISGGFCDQSTVKVVAVPNTRHVVTLNDDRSHNVRQVTMWKLGCEETDVISKICDIPIPYMTGSAGSENVRSVCSDISGGMMAIASTLKDITMIDIDKQTILWNSSVSTPTIPDVAVNDIYIIGGERMRLLLCVCTDGSVYKVIVGTDTSLPANSDGCETDKKVNSDISEQSTVGVCSDQQACSVMECSWHTPCQQPNTSYLSTLRYHPKPSPLHTLYIMRSDSCLLSAVIDCECRCDSDSKRNYKLTGKCFEGVGGVEGWGMKCTGSDSQQISISAGSLIYIYHLPPVTASGGASGETPRPVAVSPVFVHDCHGTSDVTAHLWLPSGGHDDVMAVSADRGGELHVWRGNYTATGEAPGTEDERGDTGK